MSKLVSRPEKPDGSHATTAAEPNMKRVELKRIVEFLWKGSPADEKTPFASQGTLPDNGSFSKNSEADDNKKAAKEFPEDEGKGVEGPMSIPRKLCFAMSFNLWILYFLVLGWLLPCGHHECIHHPENIERTLPNVWPQTDMEIINKKGLPSLAILGYADGKDLKLAALATFDATFEWNNTVPFVPRKIQCNFEKIFDANEDGIPDCLLSGFNDVYAFNASNGHVFWHRSLPSEEGNILSGFHPTAVHGGKTYLIGTYGDKMVVLGARSGNKTLEIDLPCSSPMDARIVSSFNLTLWNLVCDFGDKIEAWSFDERDVLNGGNSENNANATEFALSFRGLNSGRGSIDLSRDVMPVPGGPLLLSLSDRVVMVTREEIAWEKFFPDPLTVASIALDKDNDKVAVAIINGTDTMVILIRLKDGIVSGLVQLENRLAKSIERVPGDKDLLLLKSVIPGNATCQTYRWSDPVSCDLTNFALINIHSTPTKITEVANDATVLRSSLNTQTNGETDLLVLKTENGTTSYKKYVIPGSTAQSPTCHGSFEL